LYQTYFFEKVQVAGIPLNRARLAPQTNKCRVITCCLTNSLKSSKTEKKWFKQKLAAFGTRLVNKTKSSVCVWPVGVHVLFTSLYSSILRPFVISETCASARQVDFL